MFSIYQILGERICAMFWKFRRKMSRKSVLIRNRSTQVNLTDSAVGYNTAKCLNNMTNQNNSANLHAVCFNRKFIWRLTTTYSASGWGRYWWWAVGTSLVRKEMTKKKNVSNLAIKVTRCECVQLDTLPICRLTNCRWPWHETMSQRTGSHEGTKLFDAKTNEEDEEKKEEEKEEEDKRWTRKSLQPNREIRQWISRSPIGK